MADVRMTPVVHVDVYDGAGAIAARFEGGDGFAVRMPAKEAGAGGYGVVSATGQLALTDPLPESLHDWTIVRTEALAQGIDNFDDADAEPQAVLIRGKGGVALSAAQRATLAREVRAHPRQIFLRWRLSAKALYPALDADQWASCIDAHRSGPTACGVVARADGAGVAALVARRARNADLRAAGASWGRQQGFEASAYATEYAAWQEAFLVDLKAVIAALEAGGAQRSALQNAASDDAALAPLFAASIADTAKGRSLKRFIIAGRMGAPNASTMPGLFIRQVLGNPYLKSGQSSTRAVGYGGRFVDGAISSEALYILPAGLDSLRPGSPEPSRPYRRAVEALAGLALPPFAVLQRDTWPMLLFVRAPGGQLLLAAMTREMYAICEGLAAAAAPF
ncbi:hypothetical protein AAKU55_002176 [Oxalobacteraceae bacterium GrIS 1.11]